MLIYTCKVSGDGSEDVRCLRSCVNYMKETKAEKDTDAKFGVQLHGQRPGDVFIQRVKSVANQKWWTII